MAVHPGKERAGPRTAVEARSTVDSKLRIAVSERLGPTRFGLWFGDSVKLGLSGEGESLEVRVPDSFFRDWIQTHYASSLLEVAESVLGRPIKLAIRIQNEMEPPLGDVVVPTPDDPEPSGPPSRQTIVTIPLPGSPQEPLSLPDLPEAPGPPSPFPPPRTDRPRLAARPHGTSASTIAGASATPGPLNRPARRLDDFITGPGSRVAHAAAREMAQSAGAAFNPLVIHSAVGLGKTHLLEGIGHAMRQAYPKLEHRSVHSRSFHQ